jgi:hypothetical protein
MSERAKMIETRSNVKRHLTPNILPVESVIVQVTIVVSPQSIVAVEFLLIVQSVIAFSKILVSNRRWYHETIDSPAVESVVDAGECVKTISLYKPISPGTGPRVEALPHKCG